jgi:chaperonin cofactor prefoldin
LPVEDITYSFDAQEFPQLLNQDKTSKSTATTAHETNSFLASPTTAVSAITEGMVSNTVKSSLSEYEKRRKVAADASELRMKRLEQQVGSINQHFDSLTGRIEQTIAKALTADNGIIAQQRAEIQHLDQQFHRMETIVEQLANHIQELLNRDRRAHEQLSTPVSSPNRKNRRTDNQSAVGDDTASASTDPLEDAPMADPPPVALNPCQH